jgi:hypothetical protein
MTATGEAPATDPAASITDPGSGDRWYPYPLTGELFDSVTSVIHGTDAKPWIAKWHGSSSMAWAVDHMDLLRQTLSSGGRKAAIDLGKDEADRLRQVKADAGIYVHDVMESLILWATTTGRAGHQVPLPLLPAHLEDALYDGEPLRDVVDAMVDGFVQWVIDFDPRFLATEMPVYNAELRVAGTGDIIAELDGMDICETWNCHLGQHCPGRGAHAVPVPGAKLVVFIDGKTGRNPEGTWKEQLAAYRRCPECRPDKLDTALYPTPKTRAGAVLHMRKEYPDRYEFILVSADDDEAAWDRFQAAAGIYRDRQKVKSKPGRVIRALRPDGSMPGPRLCDMAGEGYGRALAPLREALGADCELAMLAGFTEADVLAIRRVGPKLIETIRQMLAENGLHLAGDVAAASGEAALWLCSTSRDGASRSAGSASASRSAPASRTGTAARRCARPASTPSASRPAPGPRPTPSPRCTAARSATGTAHGRSSPGSPRSASPCRPATRSCRSTTRCGRRAAPSGAAIRRPSNSAAARACAPTPATPMTWTRSPGHPPSGPCSPARTRRRHASSSPGSML